MSGEYILGIDLGTSGPKVVVATPTGAVLDWDFSPTPVQLLPGGGAQQRPADWWTAIVTATRRLLARLEVPAGSIGAICCTAQWSGTVAVGEDGEPLMDAVIWMDSRGARYIDAMIDGPLKVQGYSLLKAQRWLRLTGGAPGRAGKDPLAHIAFIKNEFPETYEKTRTFLEPKDYLNLKLTGKVAASYDSIALHWVTDNRNLKRIEYDDKLLANAGLERDKLPDLCAATDVLGTLRPEAAAELGLGQNVQVFMGTPDLHSAAIGSGAVRDYEAHLYIGSSSWLVCHVPFKKTDLIRNVATLPSANPKRYLVANTQETACGCLTYLLDNLLFAEDSLKVGDKPADAHARFSQVAAGAPAGSEMLIFTPWLYGERTPVENPALRGGFFNLSLKHERAHLARAVLEGVAYNSRWLLGAIETFIKRRIDSLAMIGGGAQSNLWCQIHADILDRQIRQIKDPILANVRGAVFVAAVGLGHMDFADIPNHVAVARVFEPHARSRALYNQLFAFYLEIHAKNRAIYSRLNQEQPRAP